MAQSIAQGICRAFVILILSEAVKSAPFLRLSLKKMPILIAIDSSIKIFLIHVL